MDKDLVINNLIAMLAKTMDSGSTGQIIISINQGEFQIQKEDGVPLVYAVEDYTELQTAANKVIEYGWEDEVRHFEACDEEEQEDHILNSLQILEDTFGSLDN